jgi:hypothetical protein
MVGCKFVIKYLSKTIFFFFFLVCIGLKVMLFHVGDFVGFIMID